MKRNIYKLVIKQSATGEIVFGIDEPLGIDEALGMEGTGIPTITPEGYQFYNVQIKKILYYLTCSGGEYLQCSSGDNLRANNI